jgi:uncharacterized membrane protein
MALDLFELGTLIDIVLARRFLVPFAIGLAVAVAVYYSTGQTPASAAIAFFIGLVGLIAGVVFQLAGRNRGNL